MWLFATFGPELGAFLPGDSEEACKENWPSQDLLSEAFNVFQNCNVFMTSFAPFTARTCGPSWYIREFPAKDARYEVETNAILKAYLTPRFLSSRTTSNASTDSFRVYGYQPNLVARQFGLVQVRPCPFYHSEKDMKKPRTEAQWRTILLKFNKDFPNFNPLHFKLSYECTHSFFVWWRKHFSNGSEKVNPDNLLSELVYVTPYFY